jgi:hypothetical protein
MRQSPIDMLFWLGTSVKDRERQERKIPKTLPVDREWKEMEMESQQIQDCRDREKQERERLERQERGWSTEEWLESKPSDSKPRPTLLEDISHKNGVKVKTRKRDALRWNRHILEYNNPNSLRRLRELIRTRYELDNDIWRMKNVRLVDRPIVTDKMIRADMVMNEIRDIVCTWDNSTGSWTAEQWELAQEVRNRLLDDGKRNWQQSPPWREG